MMDPRRIVRNAAAGCLILIVLAACGADGSDGDPGDVADAPARVAEAKIFDESLENDTCAVLTRDDVSAAAGVPLAAVERPYASMCLYSWDEADGRPDGNLNVMSVRVHETAEAARREYATFTQDVTAEDVGAAKDRVQEELADERAEGGITEREEGVASAVVETMPEMDFTHRGWDDIGDAASTDGRGTVRVLYGNVNVWVTGKTASEDWIDPDVAREVARRVVANLDGIG